MSNNFDGPIILDSLADATGPAGTGYLGTGGRTGADSNGPRLSGGSLANQPASASVPDGSLFMADNASLWISIGVAWIQISSDSLQQITGVGADAVAAQTQTVSVVGALPGDNCQATLLNDDTGAALGSITACVCVVPNAVDVTFTNAPTNSDGVVQVAAFGTRQI